MMPYKYAMLSRTRRHQQILDLIDEYQIPNQQQLQELLAGNGIEVTQATLSRDLRTLGVVKGPNGYALPSPTTTPPTEDSLWKTVRRELLDAVAGGATVVLRTRPGHANALAVELDRARPADVLGTIAGDDTIFVAAKSQRHARTLVGRFRMHADLR